MNIPARFQIFSRPVVISTKDEERLTPHLDSWAKLNEMFLLDAFQEPDLRMLLIIELRTRQRRPIIRRLIGRLGKKSRLTLNAKIRRLLS